ncbi:LPXTG-motif cell wall anchor domain protein, partial [Enterococcus faecium TX0082]|uniref:VaFE repeat-containing surface-anchored protein n=3 Tax=Enterococcus TaxID=1350 RepID=UPI0001EB84F5
KTTGQVVKTVVTDKDGYATFGKNAVVFDTYILSETKGKEGYKLFEPFEVTISENGQTFHYVLEDKIIEQKLKVVKVDEETGKVIAIPGTQFKIWDRLANNGQGGYVSMALPNDTELSDVFTTNEKGYFVTTDTLKYGKDRYELREIKAPEKYVLNTVPYVFSVTNDTDTIQLINFANRLAKANVEVFKYDTTTNFDKKTAIASVEFDLFKKDEIGTTFVGTFKTDTDGKIKVNDLLVGNYFFKEVKPLAGYLTLDKDVPFTVTVDKDGTVIALEVENKRIPPEIGTTAMGKYTNQPKVNPLTKVTITDTVKYSNLIVGKTYTVNGVLMDKEASIKAGKDVPLLVNGKEVTASKVFIAENPDGTISLDFIFDASALAGKETVVFENVYRDGRLVASHTDIHDEGQTVRIVNPKIHTKATGQNGEKQLQALPNQKVVEWVQLNDLIVGQMYKLLVQGYITPDGVKLDDTSAEKIFKADKETMEFLFHFLVDGRKLAGKGLSFAEWLEAQSEPKDENDREEHFEQVAQHNVNLKSKEQTVYFEEIPKAPQPKIPEKPQPVQSVKEVKQEVVVPMLPKTGEQTSSILMVLGLAVLVIVLGVTFYKVRKTKE